MNCFLFGQRDHLLNLWLNELGFGASGHDVTLALPLDDHGTNQIPAQSLAVATVSVQFFPGNSMSHRSTPWDLPVDLSQLKIHVYQLGFQLVQRGLAEVADPQKIVLTHP